VDGGGVKMGVNLFRIYKNPDENLQTHALLSVLDFIRICDVILLRKILKRLNILSRYKITNEVGITFLPTKIKGRRISWDGQIDTSKSLIAIESKISHSALKNSQIKNHLLKIKKIHGYKEKKLVIISPFDKNWLKSKYQILKSEIVHLLSWGEVYRVLREETIKLKNKVLLKNIITQYLDFIKDTQDVAGFIQTLNPIILGDLIKKIESGQTKEFHVPKKKKIYDTPNLRVFLYSKEKGIFAYFVSAGITWDSKRDGEYGGKYEYCFKIDSYTKIDPIAQKQVMELLKSKNLKKWKKRAQPLFKLDNEKTDILEQTMLQRKIARRIE